MLRSARASTSRARSSSRPSPSAPSPGGASVSARALWNRVSAPDARNAVQVRPTAASAELADGSGAHGMHLIAAHGVHERRHEDTVGRSGVNSVGASGHALQLRDGRQEVGCHCAAAVQHPLQSLELACKLVRGQERTAIASLRHQRFASSTQLLEAGKARARVGDSLPVQLLQLCAQPVRG